jgi:hypothetical protein
MARRSCADTRQKARTFRRSSFFTSSSGVTLWLTECSDAGIAFAALNSAWHVGASLSMARAAVATSIPAQTDSRLGGVYP